MIRVRHNKKRFLLIGLMAFLVVSIPITLSLLLSSGSFDQRSEAISEIGVDLDPKTGNISEEGLDIDLIVDTHGERISGIDLTLRYSGEVEYRGFFQGKIENCTVKDVSKVENEINLQCFIDPDSPTYEGSGALFATANFRATGSGTVTIEAIGVFFYVRDARGEVRFLGGRGEYEAQGESTEDKLGMQLNPSSGAIPNEGLDIDLIIDTHDEEIDGIDVTLEYSGEIKYVNAQVGEIDGCVVKEIKPEDKVVNLSCSFDSEKPVYKGSGDVFATILVKPTGTGSAEIQITKVEFSVRDSSDKLSFLGGSGTYSIGEAGYPGPEPEIPQPQPKPQPEVPPAPPSDDLPETAIFDSAGIVVGIILVLISAMIFMYKGRGSNESFLMRNKLCL